MFNRITCLLLVSAALFAGCKNVQSEKEHTYNIIPQPAELTPHSGVFLVDRETIIHADTSQEETRIVIDQFKETIESATGYNLSIESDTPAEKKNVISFELDEEGDFPGEEAYRLIASEDAVQVQAPASGGLFYGLQSLLQLLPAEVYEGDDTVVPQDIEWSIPAVEINDHPRFAYRGLHLDVVRHFFPVDFVKNYLDLMAMHKLNRFHWHLTDDQGWRIEIEEYPRLTEVGAWRDSTLIGHYHDKPNDYENERYGGYYTQEEIREVVEYAQQRNITIVPEIEMPGHASAAIASYPELGCKPDSDYQVQYTWGIFEDIFCPSEETFTFLENVLDEVMVLFPGEYIHIGGDEAPKAQWEESELAQRVIAREELKDEHELQSYFITRMESYLNEHGRQIIGWDEILEGGLAPNATVMSWRGTSGGIEAAKQGHDVVMTPGTHLYLDYYQADAESEPLAIGWQTPLEQTYSYEPIPKELSKEEGDHILGAQGNLWTEYMKSGNKVEYMAYPRASALSEVVWSPRSKRNWTGFWRRLQIHFDRFDVLDVNAADHYRGMMPSFNYE